jgi:hypothetical protein
MDELRFQDLSERHYGISPGVGAGIAEAACVCLDRHHVSAVDFEIENAQAASAGRANWSPASERVKAAWNNEIDTTEDGACALALAAIENCRGLVAVRRAETKTGADYYLDVPGAELLDLETAIRLEVSGVDRGAPSVVRTRLNRKIAQARNGDSNLPAIACVVGFAALKIMTADV